MNINDNSQYDLEQFVKIPKLTKKILNKTLIELESDNVFIFPEFVKDADDIDNSQMILFKSKLQYRTSNIMGFLGMGNERLVISSRFSHETDDYFMQYLLSKVLDIPNILDLQSDAHSENKLFYLLLFLFPMYLKQALRKGLYKTYVKTYQNDANVKGAIDVRRHIKLNTPFIGSVAYNQSEMSYDNDLMELIRHTIEYIKQKSFGSKILHKVSDEAHSVIEVTSSYQYHQRRKILELNKKNLVRHAYFHEYQTLQRLCIMILENEKLQMGSSNKQVYGILFDGAWLWEEYVNTLIKDQFYHPMNNQSIGAQRLFSTEKSKVGMIYPDFISLNTKDRVIADAKYKPIDNIAGLDYLQILAYMFRFDAKKGMYLYPDSIHDQLKFYNLNSGTTFEGNVSVRDDVFVVKLGMNIPLIAEDYDDFSKQMHESEATFLLEISNINL